MAYTPKRIKKFLIAANRDLGSGEYTAEQLTIDYCMAVSIGQQLEAENEKLRNFLLCEIDHDKAFVGLAGAVEKDNMQMFINRAEQILKG